MHLKRFHLSRGIRDRGNFKRKYFAIVVFELEQRIIFVYDYNRINLTDVFNNRDL